MQPDQHSLVSGIPPSLMIIIQLQSPCCKREHMPLICSARGAYENQPPAESQDLLLIMIRLRIGRNRSKRDQLNYEELQFLEITNHYGLS